ncbi:MAG: methyltransferase domain-containing protein [Lutibacter sp.]|nr:methyltransferase domain-containing protein [Lutibacter sp.]MDP3946096.1 methyltransferase domain-containing protein [Lutibacter sp.]
MRLHRNLVFTVIDSVKSIFNEGEYADKAVEKALKRDARWGARDRKFVAETIYEMVRWKRLYNEIAGTKEHYTTENVWKNFSVWAILKGIKLPEWNQLQGVPERRIKGKFDELQKVRVFKESIPDWLDEMGVKELGEAQWTKEIHQLNEQADVILRANTLKTTKANLQKKLMDEGIETEFIQGYTNALKLVERANVFKTECFKLGFFEVQDASSQLVAEYLDVKPGMRVIDTCAGAGGKSLHLAMLMENKGQIIATDIYESKLRKLKIRTRRAGVFNITTKEIDSPKVMKKMKGTADRVLIDAPCSGIGVLRRNPDSKWKLEPEFVENIIKTQKEILENYSQLVKPGGKLVYATCSIFPSENEKQVHSFLKNHPEFIFEKEHKVSPAKSGFDGFYMALIKRAE